MNNFKEGSIVSFFGEVTINSCTFFIISAVACNYSFC